MLAPYLSFQCSFLIFINNKNVCVIGKQNKVRLNLLYHLYKLEKAMGKTQSLAEHHTQQSICQITSQVFFFAVFCKIYYFFIAV